MSERKREFVELVRVTAVTQNGLTVECRPETFEVYDRDVLTLEVDFERGTMRVVQPSD